MPIKCNTAVVLGEDISTVIKEQFKINAQYVRVPCHIPGT